MLSKIEVLDKGTLFLIIDEFYRRAFVDPIIGHFFFSKDREVLVAHQYAFSGAMLQVGGVPRYSGRPLKGVHRALKIRKVHFDRRQVLLAEVLGETALAPDLCRDWLLQEESLRESIVGVVGCC